MIECVDAVTIEEAREISEGLDTDQDRAEEAKTCITCEKEATYGRFYVFMTTEKVKSGFLVFPRHYLHLLENIDAITICFNFCYEILSKSQKYHRNNNQNLSVTL